MKTTITPSHLIELFDVSCDVAERCEEAASSLDRSIEVDGYREAVDGLRAAMRFAGRVREGAVDERLLELVTAE